MAAISEYMESGVLGQLLRGISFPIPSNISIALTSGVPQANSTGATLPELPTSINGSSTGYSRLNLNSPVTSGTAIWSYTTSDFSDSSGVVRNVNQFTFNTFLLDMGWTSGIAVLDNPTVGSGNLLMYSQVGNPRIFYMGDQPKFDATTFQLGLI